MIWFGNARLFQFMEPVQYDSQQLDAVLDPFAFTPCLKHLASSMGWESPVPVPGHPLVYTMNGCLFMNFRSDKKLVPNSLIKQALAEQSLQFETREGRSPSKKEKADLKEAIIHHLTSLALCQSSRTYAYIDTVDNWLLINTSSQNKADQLTQSLRQALGSLKIQAPELPSLHAVMTQWVRSQTLPSPFTFSDGCTLQDTQDQPGIIRCIRQDLATSEIQACLDEGKWVTELSLVWDEQVQFTLTHQGYLRKIKYLDILKEQTKERKPENIIEQWDTDTSLMTQALRRLIQDLMKGLK